MMCENCENCEKMKVRIRDLEEVSRTATGAYDALKVLGADKYLPGYNRSVNRLQEVLEN